MSHTALNSGMGVTRWIGHTVEKIPVPYGTDEQRHLLTGLVNQIIAGKATDSAVDTGADENHIDQLVYRLYGLTDDEISAIDEGAQIR